MSDSDFTIPISQSEDFHAGNSAEYGYKTLQKGDLLNDRFSIVRELGSGGFATTYLAVDTQSLKKSKCAVKQLQPRFNTSAVWNNAKDRLSTEAMVLQWLGKHDQIPQFICHFEEKQQFYLVLEFIEGEEFEQEVRGQTLNEAEAIYFLSDILKILESVHQQGIIHRDIKPSNLIRRKSDGKIILIDFGAVKEIGTLAFDTAKQEIQTQIIGTPGYMSPEQNNGKPKYSSDIYALGMTVVFGMTNKSPMEWEEAESGGVTAWNKKLAVSEAFLKIINRMTANNPSERYSSALDVLQDLLPLQMISKTISNKYEIVKYLGGKRKSHSYVANSLESEEQSRYYLEIVEPRTSELSLAQRSQEIITGFNSLAEADSNRRSPTIVEYFIDESKIYIVQEYIEGKNLAEIIEDQFILSETEVINILLGAANGLHPFHKQRIIHGNIKPSSLIRQSKDGEIVLTDFNLVNKAIGINPNSKTGYIPPEQISGRANYVSDIYALGMTAIHVLTGTSPQALEKNPRTGEILWHRKARISPNFAKILDKMIRLEKNQRYQSLNRVIKDLKKIKHESRIKGIYKYLFIPPVLLFLGFLGFLGWAQWSQRAAILEFNLGDSFFREDQYKEAIGYYNSGLKKLPTTKGQVRNYEQVWLKKAKAQRQLQDYQEALKTCDRALKAYKSPQLWNCKAVTLYNLQEYDAAIAAYNQAIEISPENVWLWNNRGEAYASLNQVDEAVFDYKQAIQLDASKSFVPWNNLGKLYFQQRDYEQSIAAYNEALAVKSEYLPALIGLGNVQKSSRLYTQALNSYEQALEINPRYYEAWYGKGTVAEHQGRYSSAREYYQKAARLKPDWEAANQALSRVEQRLGI